MSSWDLIVTPAAALPSHANQRGESSAPQNRVGERLDNKHAIVLYSHPRLHIISSGGMKTKGSDGRLTY